MLITMSFAFYRAGKLKMLNERTRRGFINGGTRSVKWKAPDGGVR